jgi:hypothetical protein
VTQPIQPAQPSGQPRPFDERAALEELERLADKIQSSRRQRENAVAEFETFVKTFRQDRYEQLIAQHAAEQQAAGQAAAAPGNPRDRALDPHPPLAGAAASAAPTPPPTTPLAAKPRDPIAVTVQVSSGKAWSTGVSALLKPPYIRLAAAATAVIVLLLLVTWIWPESSTTPSRQPSAILPAAQAPAAAPAPAPAPVASTGPARALSIELVTTRPVWMRVTADDRRALEREVPADQRIPVEADRSILIRAGDGGAVRLIIKGQDQGALGRDGQIANRSLAAR